MSRRVTVIVGLACGVTALCAVVAAAMTSVSKPSADAVATARYLRARIAVEDTVAGNMAAGNREARLWARGIIAHCPATTAGPDSAQAAKLRLEIFDGVAARADRRDHLAIREFQAQVSRLRWTDRRIAPLIHAATAQELTAASAPLPHVCSDVRFWRASDYRKVSAGTQRVLARSRAASTTVARKLTILHMQKATAGRAILTLLLWHAPSSEKRRIRHLMVREEELVFRDELAAVVAVEGSVARQLGVGRTP